MVSVDDLRANLRGEPIQPSNESDDNVRALQRAMIARCVDAADVIACVNYARQNDTLVAIRGREHNDAGQGSCDDGLVIDLSQRNGVRVDPRAKTVRVEGNCTFRLWMTSCQKPSD
jgi:FAD/FMN-containing dehydrogenase